MMNAYEIIEESVAIDRLKASLQRLSDMKGRMGACVEAWSSRPQVASLFKTQRAELAALQSELGVALARFHMRRE